MNSPYLQTFGSVNLIQVVRPNSATNFGRASLSANRKKSKKKIERCLVQDGDHQVSTIDYLDLAKFIDKQRPSSSRSETFVFRLIAIKTERFSRFRNVGNEKKKVRPKARLQSKSFRIKLFRNGDYDRFCVCTFTTLHAVRIFVCRNKTSKKFSRSKIFQYATEKLSLALAARRLFDVNGQEIFQMSQIQADEEYFVSTGENFKNPYQYVESLSRNEKKILSESSFPCF